MRGIEIKTAERHEQGEAASSVGQLGDPEASPCIPRSRNDLIDKSNAMQSGRAHQLDNWSAGGDWRGAGPEPSKRSFPPDKPRAPVPRQSPPRGGPAPIRRTWSAESGSISQKGIFSYMNPQGLLRASVSDHWRIDVWRIQVNFSLDIRLVGVRMGRRASSPDLTLILALAELAERLVRSRRTRRATLPWARMSRLVSKLVGGR